MVPSENISAFESDWLPINTSGAMYLKLTKTNHIWIFHEFLSIYMEVPKTVAGMLVPCRIRDVPKSEIFSVISDGDDGRLLPLLCESQMLSGFRSRWTMPLPARTFRASAEIRKNSH
jgi:hypothetical protein